MKSKKSKCDTNYKSHPNDPNKFYVFKFLYFYIFKEGGQILLEVLIAIGLIAVIATLAMMFLQVGQRTTKESAQRTRAFELAAEAQEIVRSIAENDWNDVCDACLTSTSTPCNPNSPKEGYTTTTACKIIAGDLYHPNPTSTGWMLAPSSTTVSSGGINFTRSVVIDNVCRDDSGAIVPGGTPGDGGGEIGGCDSLGCTLNNFVGFDTGGLEETSAVSVIAPPTVQSTIVRTGDYSIGLNGASSSFQIPMLEGGSSDAGNDYIVGFAVYLAAATTLKIVSAYDNAERSWELGFSNNRLMLADANYYIIDSGITIVESATWHFIEIRWQHSDSGAVDVYLNGSPEISSTGEDLSAGGSINTAAYYNFYFGGSATYFDDIYAYSGASGTDDFLGYAEVFGYQNTVEDATDVGDTLDVGTWADAGQTPLNAIGVAKYTGAKSGGSTTNEGSRSGPKNDPRIDGDSNIKGAKWIHRLRYESGGSAPTHYKRYGKSADGSTDAMTSTPVLLSTTAQNFFTILEDPNLVPLSNEYFQYGMGKSGTGRPIVAEEIWAMLLHVPSPPPSISCEDDPSTRKVTVTVSAQGMKDVSLVTYLTRWGKKDAQISDKPSSQIVYQSDWAGGTTTTVPTITRVATSSITNLGSIFGLYGSWATSSTSTFVTSTGLNFWSLLGSLFGEPQ